MPIRIVQVDAFTNRPFAGNPAAVCVLPEAMPEQWLRDVSSSTIGREVFVAGQLATLERVEIERTRAEWGEVWKAASKKKLRQWL